MDSIAYIEVNKAIRDLKSVLYKHYMWNDSKIVIRVNRKVYSQIKEDVYSSYSFHAHYKEFGRDVNLYHEADIELIKKERVE